MGICYVTILWYHRTKCSNCRFERYWIFCLTWRGYNGYWFIPYLRNGVLIIYTGFLLWPYGTLINNAIECGQGRFCMGYLFQISSQLECARIYAVMLVLHYNDVITSAMASQSTCLTIVYWTIYSGTDQRRHQSSASLAFVRGIHRWPVKFPSQRASNAENVSIWWRHHDFGAMPYCNTGIILAIPQAGHLYVYHFLIPCLCGHIGNADNSLIFMDMIPCINGLFCEPWFISPLEFTSQDITETFRYGPSVVHCLSNRKLPMAMLSRRKGLKSVLRSLWWIITCQDAISFNFSIILRSRAPPYSGNKSCSSRITLHTLLQFARNRFNAPGHLHAHDIVRNSLAAVVSGCRFPFCFTKRQTESIVGAFSFPPSLFRHAWKVLFFMATTNLKNSKGGNDTSFCFFDSNNLNKKTGMYSRYCICIFRFS